MINTTKQFGLTIVWVILAVTLAACGGGTSNKAVTHKSGKMISSKLVKSYSNDDIRISGIQAKYPVKVYRVVYETKNIDGSFVNASGLVTIPQKSTNAKSPSILFHHGTIYQNKYAPTNNIKKDSSWVLPGYLGFIVVSPDYIGYGESQGVMHPYANAKITASTSVDLLRATKALLKTEHINSNNQLFLGGYSQGGGAAIASQQLLETQLADEFSVTATSAGAGAYAISKELIEQAQLLNNNYKTAIIPRPSNIGFVLKAMDEAYQLNMIDDIFQEKYAPVINTIYDVTQSATAIDKKLTHKASDLLKQDFLQQLLNGENPALVNAFKDNDIYDWSPKAPTRLYHGKEDDWVPFKQSQIAFDTMTENGAIDLQIVECVAGENKPTNHANCFVPYLFSSYKFFLQYATDL